MIAPGTTAWWVMALLVWLTALAALLYDLAAYGPKR